MHISELVNLKEKKQLHFGNLKKPSQVIVTFHLAFKLSCCSHIQRGNETFDISTMSIMKQTGTKGDIDNWVEVGDFCQQQRNADTSEHVSMFRWHLLASTSEKTGHGPPTCDEDSLKLWTYPFMRWWSSDPSWAEPKLDFQSYPSIIPACQIYATNMARPKWHNSFYTNITQNQEISSRVLLFSRFDFDLSFSTSLNPQIISIKKLLVHKKTHHQPTSKKSHNLSNMRNHNPRMFWSYPTVYDRMNGSFPSPQLAEFHLLDPPERMTSERQLHGPKVENSMPSDLRYSYTICQ